MAGADRTVSFEDRYSSDPEFKKQVDEGRRRMKERETTKHVKAALDMVREKKKLY